MGEGGRQAGRGGGGDRRGREQVVGEPDGGKAHDSAVEGVRSVACLDQPVMCRCPVHLSRHPFPFLPPALSLLLFLQQELGFLADGERSAEDVAVQHHVEGVGP